ncbi:GNAT family N-acetyltransferase [Tenggerimyces flavus]|uniref:GNAT family N-acetyltransferase n=1 Tax=Tenggerimyces flavus TaxID=1708749 RepID=A0ABV7Y981_9ACTN|nr:GNAT family N-acetyltransferase [Tenggerimyces flavus]MBM7785586.1 GNAT superfamily N-acetyltransferase [Tenggerimyces flavus]
MSLVIREAVAADLPPLLRMLAEDSIREVAENVPSSSEVDGRYVCAFAQIAADPNSLLLVAELSGELVATAQLNFIRQLSYFGGLIAQVESVRTVSHLRGQGIGKTLMDWVIDESRRRGCARLQLTTNVARVDAHRFYERLGFKASHVGMKLYLREG